MNEGLMGILGLIVDILIYGYAVYYIYMELGPDLAIIFLLVLIWLHQRMHG